MTIFEIGDIIVNKKNVVCRVKKAKVLGYNSPDNEPYTLKLLVLDGESCLINKIVNANPLNYKIKRNFFKL